MSLATPSVQTISDNIVAQLEVEFNQTIPLLPKAFNRVIAKVSAGLLILLYKYAGFIFLQTFVRTATMDEVEIGGKTVRPLVEWGRLVGVGDPNPAVQAEFDITIIVETQVGQLDSGTQLLNADNGVTYVLVGAVPLDAATKTGQVRAAFDQGGGNGSGVIGNLQVGETMSFAGSQANVVREVTIAAVNVTGANEELEEAYRTRVLDRFQQPLQGGALIDYVAWSGEVSGVANTYPYSGGNPGEVDVYAEGTVAAFPPDGIPDNALLQQVLDSIELNASGLATRRPVNAFPNVFPITRRAFNVTLTGLANVVDQAQVETDIEAALEEFFLEREPFIGGVILPPRRDRIEQTTLIGVVSQIVLQANGTFVNVEFDIGGGPITSYQLVPGEKAKLGTFTSA